VTTINCEAPDAEMLAINERLMIAGIRQQEYAEVARRTEQRLRDLVHGLDAVICEVDMRTGQPAFLSLRAETFLGHALAHWHAQPDFLAEIIHPRERQQVTALFPAFVQNGLDYEYEFRALSPDTDWIWMRNIVRLVYSPAGELEMLRCVIVDVTAQKQAALALEQTAMTLEQHCGNLAAISAVHAPRGLVSGPGSQDALRSPIQRSAGRRRLLGYLCV